MSKIKDKIIDVFKKIERISIKKIDENINQIYFKKYRVLKLISSTKFSLIYEGINIRTQRKVAIKLEKRNNHELLEKEAYRLFSLKGYGIVDLISFGKNKKYNIMIQPLLGDSLNSFFLKCNKKFNLSDICLIAIQCLERIEWIHKNNIIHRDIKPDNFLFGIKDPRIIYLIDFGLSKKYRSERTMKHIKYCYIKKIIGTAKYNSVNSLRGFEISRRDDLESFCYMIIYFLIKKLPWEDVKEKNKIEKYRKIFELKSIFDIDDYKILLPKEIIFIFKYVKNLKFDEEPNYLIIKNLFKSILANIGHSYKETFSWIKDKNLLNSKIISDFSKRKKTLKDRILDELTKYRSETFSYRNVPSENIDNSSSLPRNTNFYCNSFKNLKNIITEISNLSSYNRNVVPKNNINYAQTIESKLSIRSNRIRINYTKCSNKSKCLKIKKLPNSINIRLNKLKDIENELKKNKIKKNKLNKNFSYYNEHINTKLINYSKICTNKNTKNLSFEYKNLFRFNNNNKSQKYITSYNTFSINNNIISKNNQNNLIFYKLNKPKFIINNTYIDNFNNNNIVHSLYQNTLSNNNNRSFNKLLKSKGDEEINKYKKNNKNIINNDNDFL